MNDEELKIAVGILTDLEDIDNWYYTDKDIFNKGEYEIYILTKDNKGLKYIELDKMIAGLMKYGLITLEDAVLLRLQI